MPDRETVAACCTLASRLESLRDQIRKFHQSGTDYSYRKSPDYLAVREAVFDCYETLSSLCDTAPENLIRGHVDRIVQNLESRKASE